VIDWASSPYGLSAAWHASKVLWQQTLAAAFHHLPLLAGVAAAPAAIRSFLILESRPLRAWELNLAEAILTLWRVLICATAIWVTLTPREWAAFEQRLRHPDQFQMAVQHLGAHLGSALHLLAWEMVLLAFALWVIHVLLSLLADRLALRGDEDRHILRYKAWSSVLRNLILAPLALIYLASLAKDALAG
jgi:hypothetical protein